MRSELCEEVPLGRTLNDAPINREAGAGGLRKLEVRSLPEMLHLAFLANLGNLGNGSEAA